MEPRRNLSPAEVWLIIIGLAIGAFVFLGTVIILAATVTALYGA